MKKYFIFFLFYIFLPYSLWAKNCVSTDVVTKCARIEFLRYKTQNGDFTADSWNFMYDNHIWSGAEASCQSEKCTCEVVSPIHAKVAVYTGPGFSFDTPQEACSRVYDADMSDGLTVYGRLDGDVCPDGFYTVPYETHCGEGLVDTESVPNCNDNMSGDYCLISSIVECGDGFVLYDNECKELCNAGITKLKTSNGLTVPLFAEKLTTHALNVKYNNQVCYINLLVGRGSNAINILDADGNIWHLIE